MNVLILTPDRVGSTLLQRLVSVYAHTNDLTINLHELTNGLVNYHNDTYNRSVLGKKRKQLGYHQSLETVTGLLKDCNYRVVSRLAHFQQTVTKQ